MNTIVVPVLRNWRLLDGAVLVGEVTGHPRIANGWMITSQLVEPPDLITRTARSATRTYRLAEPWPDDQAMPAGAYSVLMARILKNVGMLGPTDATQAVAIAERIANKLVGPIAKAQTETALPMPGDDHSPI